MDLSNKEISHLKGRAQLLEPTVFLGKQGVTPAFLQSLDVALTHHELVKIRFSAFKDERREVAATIATQTASHLVMIVGHVAVFYRPRPVAAGRVTK